MKTTRMLENANKVAYIVQQWPEKKLADVVAMLQMPAIEINTALWYAADIGFITEPDKENNSVAVKNLPETWQFGERVDTLIDMLRFAFEQLEKKETDLEENYMSNWTVGYASHDVIIAMRRLQEEDEIVDYHIEDGENTYTFYTLSRNKDKLWGRKQFKSDPLDAPITGPDTPSEEA